MPYLKHIPTLWLYSMSSIKANSFSLLDKSYKKTTKYFQSILKTDSKLSAFFEYIKLDRDKSTFKSHRDFSYITYRILKNQLNVKRQS